MAAEQLGFDGMPERLYACTPSRLNTWQDCPRRYRMTYLDRPMPPKGPAWAHNSFGASVHNALAAWWRLPEAERTPAATGRYWYTEITTASVIDTKTDPGARRPSPGARPGGRGDKRGDKLPYTYELRRGERSWIARDGDDPSRTVTGIDAKAVFPTPEDQAAWKRAGSRALVPP